MRWPRDVARGVLALALLAEGAVFGWGIHHQFANRILWVEVAASVLFLVAVAALRRSEIPIRLALIGIVGFGFAFQLIVISSPPTSSDDAYRYGWDARVQLAGVDPYRYAPSAAALDGLRADTLFPDRSGCSWRLPDGRCTLINRPNVHTIYPPVAEAAFTASRLGSFGSTDGPLPIQVFGALGATAIGLLLSRWARRDRRPPWTVAIWCWCPVTVMEIGNNGHIDWLAVLFGLLAIAAAKDRRPLWSGGLLGAAIATKLYPALLAASLLRRHPRRVIAAAVAVVVLSYVPHVAAVGGSVIGYLPRYLKEEQYTSGRRFMLLDPLVPAFALTAAAALIILAAAFWAVRTTDPDHPENTAIVVIGVALLVTTPSYAWYALLLLALVALTGRVEWLGVCLMASVAMLGGPVVGNGVVFRTACYAVGALCVLVGLEWRRRHRETLADPDHPARPNLGGAPAATEPATR